MSSTPPLHKKALLFLPHKYKPHPSGKKNCVFISEYTFWAQNIYLAPLHCLLDDCFSHTCLLDNTLLLNYCNFSTCSFILQYLMCPCSRSRHDSVMLMLSLLAVIKYVPWVGSRSGAGTRGSGGFGRKIGS
jgi:hypothetical protein